MRPEDVPGELIVIACDAWRAAPQKRDGKPTRMRHALAAVWPEIEKRVRERVARESAVLPPDDLAELLDYVIGRGDVRVVREGTLDRAFAALKATLPPGESR